MGIKHYVIYDGNCNFCVTFTQFLETFDKGKLFSYFPMQDKDSLQKFNISPKDCELGMILINSNNYDQRWQGSSAAEKIVELLPNGELFINAYRAISGLKWLGERTYLQVRDNRYNWFGSQEKTYYSQFNFNCKNNSDCSV